MIHRARDLGLSLASSLPGWTILLGLGLYLSVALAFVLGTGVRVLQTFPEGSEFAPMLAIVALVLFVAFHAAALLVRYVLHLFPLRANGSRRVGCLFALVCAAPLIVLIWLPDVIQDSYPRMASFAPGWPARISLLGLYAGPLLFVLTVSGALIRRYWTPVGSKSFVLFLRRFNSFSDREVAAAVVSAAAGTVPIAFLVSPVRRVVSWDPTIICLAGHHFLHPFRNAPLFLISTSALWEDDVGRLIDAAAVIVMDGTESSFALNREIELLAQRNRLADTIWLCDEGRNGSVAYPTGRGAELLEWRKSWWWAWRRMTMWLVVVASAIAMLAPDLTGDIDLRGSGSVLTFWIVVGTITVAFLRMTLRPGLDPSFRTTMRQKLVARLAHSADADQSG